MIDFHSHILPNIDDGSRNFEESVKLIEEASKVGITGIVSTSHYLQGYYECVQEDRIDLIEQLKEQAKSKIKSDIPELYLGSEIYATEEIIELIKKRKASTINGTRYVLFEFPMNAKPLFAKDTVYKMIEMAMFQLLHTQKDIVM